MPRQNLTPERRAALLAAYPNRTNAELRLEFGLTERQITHVASSAGVRKAAEGLRRTYSHTGPLVAEQHQLITDALTAAGAAGITWNNACGLLPDLSEDRVSKRLAELVRTGTAHRAGTHRHNRWFAQADWAAAYAAQPAPHILRARATQAEREARLARTLERNARKPKKPTQHLGIVPDTGLPPTVTLGPRRGPAHLPGAPVITASTRETVCPGVPGPEARWHGDAAKHFRDHKLGEYPTEGSSWAQAAASARREAVPA